LTALYVLIDDHVIAPQQCRVGRPKRLSDAELVCLAAPGYHKRGQGRGAVDLSHHDVPAGLCPTIGDRLRLLDATPVPCGTSRPIGQRSIERYATRKGQLNLEGQGGRTPAEVHARVGQRLLALTAVIWHKESLV